MARPGNSVRILMEDPSFPLFLLLVGTFFLTVFFRISASVVLPLEAARLGMSASMVGFISSVHFYAYAFLQPVAGILHDRYGPVRVVTAGLILTAFSCLLLTVTRTPFTLGAWRLLSGFGVAPMYSATLVFQAFAFSSERFSFYAGINFALSSLGALVSVAPLGYALDTFGTAATFALLAGISLAMAAVLIGKKKKDPMHKTAAESKSLLSILPGIVSALRTIWGSRRLLSLQILWAVSSASLLSFQGLWGVSWFAAAFSIPLPSARLWSSAISVGMIVGPLLGGTMILTPSILPKIIRKVSFFNVLSWVVLMAVVGTGLPIWAGGAAIFLVGTSSGLRGVFVLAGVTALAPKESRGAIFGALNMTAVLTAVVFQWGTGLIINLYPSLAPGVYPPEGYRAGFLAVTGAMILSLLVLRMFGKEPLGSSTSP